LALSPEAIGHAIGFDRTNVIYHLRKFDGFYDTEPRYADKYEKVKHDVLVKLNGEYNENGSGEKL
jgi:hypothetical protein